MNCPVCNRDNTFNLSICPSCGAMMNDSVRAELLSKISISKSLKKTENIESKIELKENFGVSGGLSLPLAAPKERGSEPLPIIAESPKNVSITFEKSATSDIGAKATSPTLVEFHSKNATVPEWRLQLQNAVRKRGDRDNVATAQPPVKSASPARQPQVATSGANALKISTVEEKNPARAKNPALSSALARIEKSRQKFLVEESAAEMPVEFTAPQPAPRPANKNFPFYIASKQTEAEAKTADVKTVEQSVPVGFAQRPKTAAPIAGDSGDLITNKLPPLPAKIPVALTKTVETAPPAEVIKVEKRKIETKVVVPEEIVAADEHFDDFEDGAPFAMRFNAGLFDLIIGGFTSLFLLAPFILTGGEWFTFTGFLAFLATCSVVMFVYLTATIGYYGRTFGMRIFSLEVVDANGENYPTLHQAAVSSAVYILSLVFGGVGFLTMLFNRDRRAAHDLISGTMVVKEN